MTPSPLRITFVAGEYPPLQGGLGDYTRELGRALVQAGHRVTVVTRRVADAPDRGDAPGEPTARRVVDGWGWRAWPAVRRAVADADMVHIQYQTAAYGMHPFINTLPWLLRLGDLPTLPTLPMPSYDRRKSGKGGKAGWRGRPLLAITYHDTRIPYLFPKAGPLRPWVTRLPGRGADLVVATNAEDGARLGSVARALAYIPIGSNIAPLADPSARPAFRARWGIGAATPLLVYFGFVNRAKGADTLVAALARLRAAGLPAQALMLGGQVGASDPTNARFLAEVQAQAQQLGVASALVWTDFLPEAEVSAALVSADLAVLPYREGVSLQRGTLMAALAHGLPVVTTRPPVPPPPSPLPRLVDDRNAVLVPPDDPAALADAVASLWADPARRERLGAAAAELAQAFRWERIAAQHVEEYQRLMTED